MFGNGKFRKFIKNPETLNECLINFDYLIDVAEQPPVDLLPLEVPIINEIKPVQQ